VSLRQKRLSIRVIAPVMVGGLVIVVAFVLGILAWTRGRIDAEDLLDAGLREVRERTRGRLDDLIGLPPRINRINEHLIRSGRLDVERPRTWRTTMFEICTAFPHLSCIGWGDETGRATWIARYPGVDHYDYAIKDEKTGDSIEEYVYDETGGIGDTPKGRYEYDPRVRPWYTTPMNARGPAWSEPFGWVQTDGSLVALGISYAQPVKNEAGEIIGEAADRRIVAAANAIGDFDGMTGPERRAFMLGGERYLVEASPYRHASGIRWVVASVVPEVDFLGPVREANARIVAIAILASALAILAGVGLALRLARPIRELERHVHRVGGGDFKTRIALDQTREFVELSNAMNEMSEHLEDRMRLRETLQLAMEVQQNLLPAEDPDAFGLDVAGHSTYCDETGGDYYDFLDVSGTPDHTLTVAVGDVMGHGVAAAMLMATARGILHSRAKTPGSLSELLTHMNGILVRDTGGERFMTMLLLTIDADLGRMRWASAGHGAPILYDPENDAFPALGRGGLPLGLMEGMAYQEHVVERLTPGTILFPATDGVWETRNAAGKEWGLDRLHDLIRRSAGEPAAAISARIRSEVAAWRGHQPQDDDVTYVVVKVRG